MFYIADDDIKKVTFTNDGTVIIVTEKLKDPITVKYLEYLKLIGKL